MDNSQSVLSVCCCGIQHSDTVPQPQQTSYNSNRGYLFVWLNLDTDSHLPHTSSPYQEMLVKSTIFTHLGHIIFVIMNMAESGPRLL